MARDSSVGLDIVDVDKDIDKDMSGTGAGSGSIRLTLGSSIKDGASIGGGSNRSSTERKMINNILFIHYQIDMYMYTHILLYIILDTIIMLLMLHLFTVGASFPAIHLTITFYGLDLMYLEVQKCLRTVFVHSRHHIYLSTNML